MGSKWDLAVLKLETLPAADAGLGPDMGDNGISTTLGYPEAPLETRIPGDRGDATGGTKSTGDVNPSRAESSDAKV